MVDKTVQLQELRSRYTLYLKGGSSYDFDTLAMDMYAYHREYNSTYRQWCTLIRSTEPTDVASIPCMPIELFRHHRVNVMDTHSKVFESSGTTGQQVSRHEVADITLYEESFLSGWKHEYGDPSDVCILGLLPAYLEREGSSLVYMVDYLIRSSGYEGSGFFLYDHDRLYDTLVSNKTANIPTILIGVSFALLDFVERYRIEFPSLVVMETGGMKGRREEITREELHSILCEGFGIEKVHSEYGMTELLSQAYSSGDGRYTCSATMRVLLREMDDPLVRATSRRGLIDVVDLSNVYSCPFISTDDIGVLHDDGTFSVLGRMDHAAIRGCNLLVI